MREVKVIPSKSDAHRAMICAALAEIQSGLNGDEACRIICDETSKDMDATAKCLEALKEALSDASGAGCGDAPGEAEPDSRGGKPGEAERTKPAVLMCGESGSTLRFLLPVTAALGVSGDFMPEGRLPERPLSPLYEEMRAHGCEMSPQGSVPFKVRGTLEPGKYTLPGNVSSQYITGLLLALPLLEGDSVIEVTTPLESAAYVDMTLKVMRNFGVDIGVSGGERPKYVIKGGRRYWAPPVYEVEGDWSNAAFWLAAGALTEEGVKCRGLRGDSVQGDKAVADILKAMGAKVETGADFVAVERGSLHGITVDAGPIPDMIPALSLVACAAEGETRIVNAGRLRIKESDRLSSITDVLTGLGADVTELEDGLVIRGKGSLEGGKADGHNDHRIVMMAAVASIISRKPVTIEGAEAVGKSYPAFFDRMREMNLDGNLILK